MANQERGELSLVAGAAVYTLALTVQAVCALEAITRRPFAEVCTAMHTGSARDLRALLWAALQTHHARAVGAVDDVGPIIDAAGGPRTALRVACHLLRLNADNRPRPPREGRRGGADPPRAQGRHGSASMWMRDVWA